MIREKVTCEKCGISSDISYINKHQPYCDIIPFGKELDDILGDFEYLTVREIRQMLFKDVSVYFLTQRLLAGGWTDEQITERDKKAKEKKVNRGMYNLGEGAKDKYKARCMRCDILINHELEMDLRFCKYCYSENKIPDFAFERYFSFSNSVKKMTIDTGRGKVTYGYDPIMGNYWAYLRPDVNESIVIVSIGNSPEQCKTERTFRDRLVNIGLSLQEVKKIIDDSNEEKREPTNRELLLRSQLLEYIGEQTPAELSSEN